MNDQLDDLLFQLNQYSLKPPASGPISAACFHQPSSAAQAFDGLSLEVQMSTPRPPCPATPQLLFQVLKR